MFSAPSKKVSPARRSRSVRRCKRGASSLSPGVSALGTEHESFEDASRGRGKVHMVVTSHHNTPHHTTSHHLTSRHITPHHALPCHVMSYRTNSYHIMSYNQMSYRCRCRIHWNKVAGPPSWKATSVSLSPSVPSLRHGGQPTCAAQLVPLLSPPLAKTRIMPGTCLLISCSLSFAARKNLFDPDGMPCMVLWKPKALDCRALDPPRILATAHARPTYPPC